MLRRNFDFLALFVVLCGMAVIQQVSRVPAAIEKRIIQAEMRINDHRFVLPPPPPVLTHWRE
jgi:hypothetical protein